MPPKRTIWQVTDGTRTIEVQADSREEAIMKGVASLGSPRSSVTAKRVVRKAVA